MDNTTDTAQETGTAPILVGDKKRDLRAAVLVLLLEDAHTYRDIQEQTGASSSLIASVKKELEQKGRNLSLTAEPFRREVESGLGKALRVGLRMLARKGERALEPGAFRSVAQGVAALMDKARLMADQSTANVKSAVSTIAQQVERDMQEGNP